MSTVLPSPGPPRPRPAPPTVSYVLVHSGSDPAGSSAPTPSVPGLGLCGPGWTVLAAHGSRWSWSVRLDAHGAAYAASTAVAQEAAVRILSAHGIAVLGWSPSDPDARAFVAVTDAARVPSRQVPSPQVPEPVPAHRRASWRWWR